jgi:hypothetical protein
VYLCRLVGFGWSRHHENILAKEARAVFAGLGIDGVKASTESSVRQLLRDFETERASRVPMPRQFSTVGHKRPAVSDAGVCRHFSHVGGDSCHDSVCDSQDEWEIDSNFEPTEEERNQKLEEARQHQLDFLTSLMEIRDRHRRYWKSGGS